MKEYRINNELDSPINNCLSRKESNDRISRFETPEVEFDLNMEFIQNRSDPDPLAWRARGRIDRSNTHDRKGIVLC